MFDATRDVRGTFYITKRNETLIEKLRRALEDQYDTRLKLNSNSFTTCLEFDEVSILKPVVRRFKVYNKVVQLFQSECPQKAIGMRTISLFAPQSRMKKVIEEGRDEGVTRLEISYRPKNI